MKKRSICTKSTFFIIFSKNMIFSKTWYFRCQNALLWRKGLSGHILYKIWLNDCCHVWHMSTFLYVKLLTSFWNLNWNMSDSRKTANCIFSGISNISDIFLYAISHLQSIFTVSISCTVSCMTTIIQSKFIPLVLAVLYMLHSSF